MCHHRHFAGDSVPGCTGTPDDTVDYCINRDVNGYIKRLDDASFEPYRACEGDCELDEDVSSRML